MTFRLRSHSPKPRSTPEQMAEQGFHDARSRRLWRTGRIILKGKDKTDLRRRIFERAGAKCEIEFDGKRCRKYASWSGPGHGELVHILATAHGGSDTIDNCLWGCRECHRRKYHLGVQWTRSEARP